MAISCIITDDEPLARKGLQGYVEKIPFLQLAATCSDALELNNILQQSPVDLVFLDIEMPNLSGIDFLRSARNPPQVILTTAYEQYALQGFELDVLDYLLKPISFDRFLKSANKAADYFQSRREPATEYLFIKSGGKLEKVFYADIIFIEALENYLAFYTVAGKLITHATLKSVAQVMPDYFIQPHKSYLVNARHISSVEGNLLHLHQYQVPISKYLKEEVLEKVVNRHLLKGRGEGGNV